MISAYTRIPRSTQRSQAVTIAAPIGGWNARDALGDMNKNDAVVLTNMWPGTSSVILRKGMTAHVTGIGAQVESLMCYHSGAADTLFAAASTKFYNVTTAGAVGAAVVTGLTNARWQYVNFTTSGGSFLLAVNGADKLHGWSGSAWYVDGDGAHDITGVDTATCPNITVFKNRIWLVVTGSLKAWYLPINAIAGAATALDMSSLCEKGGYLMAAMTWTIDSGYGVDDYLAFITNNGEVLVWRLTDPTTPTGIGLVGVYQIGSPIGRRCWVKYAGDLLLITQDGVVPMSGALQSSRLNPRVSITDKIQLAMSDAVTSYGANFGWQLLPFPKGNQLYLNVPVKEGSQQQQYVQNNITKAWCNFTGWTANCFELLGDNLYYGANGTVFHAWNGATDNSTNIPSFAIQAFNAYGSPAQKQCKMIRFHFLTDGNPAIYGNVNVDYDLADNSAQLSAAPITLGIWDASTWDNALWGSGLAPAGNWETATAIGSVFAPILKTATQGIQLQWVATDLLFESGGVL